jgi:hypothetical protein
MKAQLDARAIAQLQQNMASTFSGGMSDPSLTTFSPAEGLVGGIFIGLSVVARLLALGTVTGISGIFGASVRLESLEKVAFSIGIFLSGVALFWGYPPPFTRVPDDLPVYRPVVAAVLVAVGTHLGNGCTRSTNVALPSFCLRAVQCQCNTCIQRPWHLRHISTQPPLHSCRATVHVRAHAIRNHFTPPPPTTNHLTLSPSLLMPHFSLFQGNRFSCRVVVEICQ